MNEKRILPCLCITCGVRNDFSNPTGFCQNDHDNWLEYQDVTQRNEVFHEAVEKSGLAEEEFVKLFMNYDNRFISMANRITLKDYYNFMLDLQTKQPISRPRPQPGGINTLWVPQWSGNRTATLNLNNQVNEYDETNNMLYGENYNCLTPYTIIEVPMWLTDEHLHIVAEILCKEMQKPAGYPTFRVLKAERIEAIKRIISTLPVPNT